MKVLWILSVSVIFWERGYAQEDDAARNLYSPRYDNLDLTTILSSFRLVTNYVECLLNRKPCPPEGKDLKRILPEALRTKCGRCTARQKENALKVIRKLYTDYPQYYRALSEKWDSTGEYNRRFQEYLQNEQFNNIGSNDFSNNRIDVGNNKRSNGTTGSDFENDQTQINVQSVPISSLNAIPTETKPPPTQRQTTRQTTQRQTSRPTTQRLTQPPTRRTTTTSTTFAPPIEQSDIFNRFGSDYEEQDVIVPAEQLSPPVTPPQEVFVTNRQTLPSTLRPNPTNPQTNAPTTKLFVSNTPIRLYITTQRPYQAPLAPQSARPQTTRLQPVTIRLPHNQNPPATSTIRQVIVRQPSPQNPSFLPSSFVVTRRPTVNIITNTEILDNFFISPAANYNPSNNLNGPIGNIFKTISSKISNTAEALAGMVRNTVQIFVGRQQ